MGQTRSRFGVGEPKKCYVCSGTDAPVLPLGCTCRSVCAHVQCVMEVKTQQLEADAPLSQMWTCPKCKHDYSGLFRGMLADMWYYAVKVDAVDGAVRPNATLFYANTLDLNGESKKALDVLDRFQADLAKAGATGYDTRLRIGRGPPTLHLAANAAPEARADMLKSHYRDMLEVITRSGLAQDHHLVVEAKMQRALNVISRDQLSATLIRVAENDLREALAVYDRSDARSSQGTVIGMQNLAHVLSKKGDVAGAIAMLDKVLPIARDVFGVTHEFTLNAESNLSIYIGRGNVRARYEEARALGRHVLAARVEAQGPRHDSVRAAQTALHGTLQRTQMLCAWPGCKTLHDAVAGPWCTRCDVKYCCEACRDGDKSGHESTCKPQVQTRKVKGGR